MKYKKSYENLEIASKRAFDSYKNHDNDEGWKLSKDENGIKIYHGSKGGIHIKSTAIIKAKNMDIIKILNCESKKEKEITEHRKYWDTKVCYAAPCLVIDNHLCIQSVRYTKYNYFFGEREFVYIRNLYDFDGTMAIVATSIEEDEVEEFPIEKKVVRGNCPLWCWIFEKVMLNEKDEIDEKGEIEATIVTYLLEASPLGWIPSFSNYYHITFSYSTLSK
jgi:hypothetical protein